jgi:hypothetical protein
MGKIYTVDEARNLRERIRYRQRLEAMTPEQLELERRKRRIKAAEYRRKRVTWLLSLPEDERERVLALQREAMAAYQRERTARNPEAVRKYRREYYLRTGK